MMAQPFAIALWLVILWTGLWLAKILEGISIGIFSTDGSWLIFLATSMGFYFLVFILIRTIIARKFQRKSQIPIEGLVRLYPEGDVPFLESGVEVRRKAQKIYLADDYVFVTIEDGKRFVYLPKRVIDTAQLEGLAKFAN